MLITSAIRDITDRKRTERQIRELKRYKELGHALDLTHTMIRDLDGTIRVWTQGAEKLYGWTAKEAMGATSHELLRTDFSEPLEEINQMLRRTGQWEGELKHHSKDGREISVASHWVLHADDASETPAVIEVNNDITARKAAEAALRESEEALRALLESASQGIISVDADGNITLANAMAEELFGYRREELIGQALEMLLPERIRQQHVQHRARYFSEPRVRPMGLGLELSARRKDGTEFPVEISLSHVKTQRGVLAVSLITDITQRKAAEATLRESEECFRMVFEESPLGKAFVRPDTGRYLRVNRAFAEMLGYEEQKFAQLTIADVTYPDDVELEDRQRVFRGELPRAHFEKRYITRSGAVIWANVHETLMRDGQGQPLYNLVIVEDITQRKRMEEELRQRNEELTEFSAIAAHDLQTPLRNVRNSVQLLAKRYKGQLDQPADQVIQYILTGTEQMQELLQALLSYAQTGEANAPKEAVRVRTIVSGVLANLRTELEQTGAEVICQELPIIQADALQLSQLFQNLIGNALKYRSERQPQITIRAVRRQHVWVFSVQDNGVGIPPEQREQIFAPLKRLHGPEIPGSGIGLAICKKIVERSGGRIWVESQIGQGSTFYFTLVPPG